MEDIETNDIGQSLVDEFIDDNAIEAQEKIGRASCRERV